MNIVIYYLFNITYIKKKKEYVANGFAF